MDILFANQPCFGRSSPCQSQGHEEDQEESPREPEPKKEHRAESAARSLARLEDLPDGIVEVRIYIVPWKTTHVNEGYGIKFASRHLIVMPAFH